MSAPMLKAYEDGGPPITGDNLNTFCQSCDIISDLRGFIGMDGMQVYMRGYSAPGDGGEGFFYWNAAGTGPDDDGVTSIVPNGAAAGCWTRIGSVFGNIAFTADLISDQSVPVSGSAAILIFNSFEFNIGGGYNPGSGVFTPTEAGSYFMSATVWFKGTTPAGPAVSLAIYRNGQASRVTNGPLLPLVGSLSAVGSLTVTGLFRMNGTTDTLDIRALGPGMTTCTAVGSSTSSYLSGQRTGP